MVTESDEAHWKINNTRTNQKQGCTRVQPSIKRVNSREKAWNEKRNKTRVWSWLRMNAGGAFKTCKSNEDLRLRIEWVIKRQVNVNLSGGRVSNT